MNTAGDTMPSLPCFQQDLRHERLLVAGLPALQRRTAAAVRHGELAALGQPLQQLGDLPDFLAFPVAKLLLHRRDHVFVKLVDEQAHVPHHDVPGDAVHNVEAQGQDNARDGGIERHLDTGQKRLHAGQRRVHAAEADALDTDDQSDEGAQNAKAGQGAGYLNHHVLPASQAQDIIVDIFLDIGKHLPGIPLALHLFLVFPEQIVHHVLMEEFLDLHHHGPGGARLHLQGPFDVFQTGLKPAVELDHREDAEQHPQEDDQFHQHDEDRGNIIRRVSCEDDASDEDKNDQ